MRTRSKNPKKQRKYENNVPYHEKHKLASVNLSPDLREKYKFRSLPVRIKDEVKIMRGSFKGVSGKVTKVNPKKRWVSIEKVTRKKTDNTEYPVKIHPSNLMLMKLHKSKDKGRIDLINRRTKDEDEFIDIDDIEEEFEDNKEDEAVALDEFEDETVATPDGFEDETDPDESEYEADPAEEDYSDLSEEAEEGENEEGDNEND